MNKPIPGKTEKKRLAEELMTTPQQDIESVLSVVSPNGTIKLERYVPGKPPGTPGGKRFRGATTHDSDLLSNCRCPRYFSEGEFDAILAKVSQFGYGLEAPE